jgi:predicted component of type VI protein secretion system
MVQKIHIQDKFQPCILSRLTDRSLTGDGSAEDSLLSRIHREILLNLKMLFNSRMHPGANDLDKWPEVRSSVLGYGLSDFCGLDNSDRIFDMVKKEISWQIRCFEPRLNPDTLVITRLDTQEADKCSLSLHIEAAFAISELKDGFSCNFYIELETGRAAVKGDA